MKRTTLLILLYLYSGIFARVNAQENANKLPSVYTYPDSLNRKAMAWVVGTHAGLYAGTMWFLNQIWYKDRASVPFHFYNDHSGYLQIDKFGHATTAFQESSISYYAFRKVGLPKNKALIYGGLMGFILQLPIEISDGLNEGWGFSWGDITANAFGSALVISQEHFFDTQIVTMKFSYWPTDYADMCNGYLGKTAFQGLSKDYNGHTYWFSTNINRITRKEFMPRWLNFAVGYSAGGMFGEFRNITEYNGVHIPETQRFRQLFFSLDVDWTKIRTNSTFVEILFKGLNIIKVPFPALQFNTKGEIVGHWLYF
jgi:hypothetical protein